MVKRRAKVTSPHIAGEQIHEEAWDLEVRSGHLYVLDGSKGILAVYAADQWYSAEIEETVTADR